MTAQRVSLLAKIPRSFVIATALATTAVGGTLLLGTAAANGDARIDSIDPTTNYGSTTTLRADVDDYDSLLTFPVTTYTAGATASLRIFVTEGSAVGPKVYATTSFPEATVTWATAPAKGALVGTFPAGATGTFIEAPLSNVTANGTYFYRISSTSVDGMSFSSREGANPPTIVISGGNGGSGSPGITPPAPTITPTKTPAATIIIPPTPAPTPASTGSTGAIKHVVVVWLENHEYPAVTATSMPYLYGLSRTYGSADAFYAIRHPSLPNYLAFWSGSTQGVTDDATYNLAGASISSQLTNKGVTWRSVMQDYPATAGCHVASTYSGGVDGNGVAGTYARKHNPAMSFTSVSIPAAECAKITPLAKFDPLIGFSFVSPNLCNDGHDCSLATVDTFLKGFLPKTLNSSDWAHTLLVVSFDEGSTSTNGGGHIFTMVARQGLSGMHSTTPFTHYSVLRTVEDIFGVPCLAAACSATSLASFMP